MSGFEFLQKVTSAGPAFARLPFFFLSVPGARWLRTHGLSELSGWHPAFKFATEATIGPELMRVATA